MPVLYFFFCSLLLSHSSINRSAEVDRLADWSV